MALTGNGADVVIYTDSEETSFQRRSVNPSVVGNQLSGTFTLKLRGWETEAIDFNAADTEMKAALETLPNVGTVDVSRIGPDGQLGYSWYVTFVDNPGYFPTGSGNIATLEANCEGLAGEGTACHVQEDVQGTDPLSGTFILAFTDSGGLTLYTEDLHYNALPEEIEASLEMLNTVGNVEVTRATGTDGYSWTVSFASCRANSTIGEDICNDGSVDLLKFASNSSLEGCGSGLASTSYVVLNGSAGDSIDVLDLSAGAPYSYDITDLEDGVAIYARVSAHTLMSYG
ncbi:unnamed protein product, partial [Discosporangium mesarthrocarpum]